jgi:ATP-binding cassette subfamily B protein
MLKPDILILDEATSNLDTITERKIERLLEGVTENITVIKIAHRLSTVFRSDNIYVISNGKIVESGSHEELLIYGGVYRTMWDMQEGIM